MSRICEECDNPVPPPRGSKRIPHKKYCSTKCRRLANDKKTRARLTQCVRIVNFMKEHCPNSLDNIMEMMGE